LRYYALAHHAVITGLCKEGKVQSLTLKNKLKNTRRGKSSGAFSLKVATIEQSGNWGKHVISNTNCRTNISTVINVHTYSCKEAVIFVGL